MNEIPIHIAVSGHRHLEDVPRLEQEAVNACGLIRQVFPEQRFQVYSCLAEGADRLLARVLMERLAASLVAVLPLAEGTYRLDFSSRESLQAFRQLKKSASSVVVLDKIKARPQAYQAANQYLLQHCQVLLAIWDGLPAHGEGGTGELVETVRQTGRMLLWMPAKPRAEGAGIVAENFPAFLFKKTKKGATDA